ncbi:MAG TPA: 3'(2'),5'-bisphosphate nucleotidase CysQ [Allosphingosinicella sp.]|nr:3'(2'),5'-bisphosphate nucleotidase CysQ [Allosphingosinicella sp.]
MTSPLLTAMIDAALEAGEEIERFYYDGCDTAQKADGSPVTEADRVAEEIILDHLGRAFPKVPVLAEEEAAEGRIPLLGSRFFCVDPLDGTRGFVERTGEFTVNIALIEDGSPVAGVIYVPVTGVLYYGARGQGAFKVQEADPEPIHTREPIAGLLTGVGSRNHGAPGTAERNTALGISDYLPSSSSLKFCLVAEGAADVYPRYGPTSEWDTAAGQAILEAAGGRVMEMDGAGTEVGPLSYGHAARGFLNPHFIAWGR